VPTATSTSTRVPTWTPTLPLTGEIRGIVWTDNNENGEIDLGEPPIEGVEIILRDDLGAKVDTAWTEVDGFYSFPNLLPGTYIVQEVDPPGYYSTTTNTVQKDVAVGDLITVDFGDKPTSGDPNKWDDSPGKAYLPCISNSF